MADDALDLIDKLVNALTEARNHIRDCFGTDSRPDSDSAFIVRDCNEALASAAAYRGDHPTVSPQLSQKQT